MCKKICFDKQAEVFEIKKIQLSYTQINYLCKINKCRILK